ncbi:methyltransferase [Candidatus Pacearchaeota archaeon]|nr:methyltransferase [Candidatus Pacearchaeota archaeon]
MKGKLWTFLDIEKRLDYISERINCKFHTQEEMLNFYYALKKIPRDLKGCIIECGSFKGGSTAKFSVFAKELNRKLVVFDSFKGIPKNNELHYDGLFKTKIGGPFKEGSYSGTLDEVKRNIRKFGEIDICEFYEGWFEDTMPNFNEDIVAIYLDVDLVSSTKTCLKYLYPLLKPGGIVFSQDGHIPLIVEMLEDAKFWKEEIGFKKPKINGLRKTKVINFVKDGNKYE